MPSAEMRGLEELLENQNVAGRAPVADSQGVLAPKILFVAGEVSGDEHSARVVTEILRRRPGAQVFGMGGKALRAAGMELVVDSEKYASVMGLTEVIGSLPKIRKAFKMILDVVEKRSPDVAVLTDYAEFNMLLAKSLRKRGVPVVFFISPQIWAWRKG